MASSVRVVMEDAHSRAAGALGVLSLTLAASRPASRAAIERCIRELREAASRLERDVLKKETK